MAEACCVPACAPGVLPPALLSLHQRVLEHPKYLQGEASGLSGGCCADVVRKHSSGEQGVLLPLWDRGTAEDLPAAVAHPSSLLALPRALPVPWLCNTSVCLFLPSAWVGAIPRPSLPGFSPFWHHW